ACGGTAKTDTGSNFTPVATPQASNPFPVNSTSGITNRLYNTGDCSNDIGLINSAFSRVVEDSGLGTSRVALYGPVMSTHYMKACKQANSELIDMVAFCKDAGGEFFGVPDCRNAFVEACTTTAKC